MTRYRLQFTKQAKKDIAKLTPKLREKLKRVLREKVAVEPYSGKALVGDLKGYYSLRLSHKDRIIYTIHDDQLLVLVIRARTHYGD